MLFHVISIAIFVFFNAKASKIKIIIDTDGVVDDMRALTIALQNPNVDLIAVTTVSGSTSAYQAVANVARTFRANKMTKNVRNSFSL